MVYVATMIKKRQPSTALRPIGSECAINRYIIKELRVELAVNMPPCWR